MINYDSILSAFDGKPTLLQWLKLIKKALDESVLKDITLKQDGANVVFTFNFEDGTSISTPAVTLPKGDTGAKGDKGDKGEQGVSVTGVDEVSNEVVGSQTLTTLRFNFSNGTNNEVVVHAENGKSGKLYRHLLTLTATDGSIFSGIRFSTSPTKFSLGDMANINSLIDKEVYIIPTNESPKIYNLFYSLEDGDNFSAPDQMVLSYYPTYPGDESTYETKGFPKTSFKDSVTEL